jgi:hypothetical protein
VPIDNIDCIAHRRAANFLGLQIVDKRKHPSDTSRVLGGFNRKVFYRCQRVSALLLDMIMKFLPFNFCFGG